MTARKTASFIEIAVDRLIILLEKDDELRQALIRLINGKAAHEEHLAGLNPGVSGEGDS